MDVTYWTHTIHSDRIGRSFDARTITPDSDYADRDGYRVEQTERTTLHLAVGTPVLVRAFGRDRPGHVVKLGRTRVTVDFQQNAAGARGTRSAHAAWDLSPAVGTPFDREVVS